MDNQIETFETQKKVNLKPLKAPSDMFRSAFAHDQLEMFDLLG